MVLELRTPHGTTWATLREDLPVLLAYVLSFVLIGIYWNNHHHMLAAVTRISGMTLWANQHLLFWLSLIPVATAWVSENHLPPIPRAPHGGVLLAPSPAHSLPPPAASNARLADRTKIAAESRPNRRYLPGLPGNALWCQQPWLPIAWSRRTRRHRATTSLHRCAVCGDKGHHFRVADGHAPAGTPSGGAYAGSFSTPSAASTSDHKSSRSRLTCIGR